MSNPHLRTPSGKPRARHFSIPFDGEPGPFNRIIFNEVVPPAMGFQNGRYNKGGLKDLVADCYSLMGIERTAEFADAIIQKMNS